MQQKANKNLAEGEFRINGARGRFSMPNLQDLDVLARIKAGDANAFSEIYAKYVPHVRQYVWSRVRDSRVTEDIVHDIMLKVWTNIGKYRVDYTFNTWLSRIMHNHMVDLHRKSLCEGIGVRISSSGGDGFGSEGGAGWIREDELGSGGSDADGLLLRRERKDFMADVLSRLGERDRRIVTLYFVEGMTYEEIADEMDIPLGTMKTFLFKAKQRIRRLSGVVSTAHELV